MGRVFKKSFKNNDWKGSMAKVIGATAGQYIKGYLDSYAYNKGKQMAVGYTNAKGSDVRFNDMGDRGGVVTKSYRKRKRTRMPKTKRKKLRKFRKAVRRVFNKKMQISALQEFWPSQFTIAANSTDTFSSTLAGNVQLILGNAAPWGINLGEVNAGGLTENSYIATEMGSYRARINSVDVAMLENELRDNAEFWIQRKYLKLTIRNTNVDKDLIFDLYECVAAMDISEAAYANPVQTWQTVQETAQILSTNSGAGVGEAFIKGTEPTDCPNFGRYWKILKKEVVRIPAQANVVNPYQTFTMHSPRFLYKGKRFADKYAVKGITKYFMMIIDPEQSATASRYSGTENVGSVIAHRNTHYKPSNRVGQLIAPVFTPNWIRQNLTTPSL